MSANFASLVAQGRAKAHGVHWSPEEWDLMVTLARHAKRHYREIAEYVRAGIKSVEEYEKVKDLTPRLKPVVYEYEMAAKPEKKAEPADVPPATGHEGSVVPGTPKGGKKK